MKYFVLIFIFLVSFNALHGQNLSANSTGSFTYIPNGPLSNQPVEVFYHIPNGDITTMPIVMSFHGANRNGDAYRDYWISMADANDFMVFAPEFSSSNYPGLGDNYLMANIFDDGDNPSPSTYNNPDQWTFSVLDPLFDYIVADISGNQQAYNGWGHSGGAQFLHRFVLYLPNSKLDVAVCSNAGWYTVPENSVSFPYGILNGELPVSNLNNAFSKMLIIHLGQNDNDPNSPGLRHNSVVDNQQGLHRLERGQYFFNTSQSEAMNLGFSFNWEKHEVAGVGHDPQQMANDALPYVMMNTLSSEVFDEKKDFSFYPNPVENYLYISLSTENIQELNIYNIYGQLVKSFQVNSSESNQRFEVSNLSRGLYILKANNISKKFLKE